MADKAAGRDGNSWEAEVGRVYLGTKALASPCANEHVVPMQALAMGTVVAAEIQDALCWLIWQLRSVTGEMEAESETDAATVCEMLGLLRGVEQAATVSTTRRRLSTLRAVGRAVESHGSAAADELLYELQRLRERLQSQVAFLGAFARHIRKRSGRRSWPAQADATVLDALHYVAADLEECWFTLRHLRGVPAARSLHRSMRSGWARKYNEVQGQWRRSQCGAAKRLG